MSKAYVGLFGLAAVTLPWIPGDRIDSEADQASQLAVRCVSWVVVHTTVSLPVGVGMEMGLEGLLLVHLGAISLGRDLVMTGLFLDLETGKARESRSEPYPATPGQPGRWPGDVELSRGVRSRSYHGLSCRSLVEKSPRKGRVRALRGSRSRRRLAVSVVLWLGLCLVKSRPAICKHGVEAGNWR